MRTGYRQYWTQHNIREEYQKSIEAINKALALDENLADAHSALCENKAYYEWDFDGADGNANGQSN